MSSGGPNTLPVELSPQSLTWRTLKILGKEKSLKNLRKMPRLQVHLLYRNILCFNSSFHYKTLKTVFVLEKTHLTKRTGDDFWVLQLHQQLALLLLFRLIESSKAF